MTAFLRPVEDAEHAVLLFAKIGHFGGKRAEISSPYELSMDQALLRAKED